VTIRTRFAPSPTGDLHVGGAWVAIASWRMARDGGGAFVLRMEDIDTPRAVRGSAERILDDLRWLGATWDEGPGDAGPFAPYTQSERAPLYQAAVDDLTARGLTYPCDCSRAEIARVASAPHAGEEAVYPGLCRDRDPAREMKRAPAIRVRVPSERVAFDDRVMGPVEQELARDVGDFVLRRGDGVFAYQLAVVVDDLAMRITDVVRGADLLASTPRQIAIARMLGADPPRYWHLPLVVASDGSRLAKRSPGGVVRALREAGLAPDEITGEIERALDAETGFRKTPWPIPERWAALTPGP
jgi:glutamyl-tRNA synthetase